MAVIPTLNGLVALDRTARPTQRRSVSLYDSYTYDYATLYRTQPNVRTCVDFLARNIAQLGWHVFRRLPSDDRERLRDHPLARLLERPLPPECKSNRYGLVFGTFADLAIYNNAYWLYLEAGGNRTGLVRIPPHMMEVKGGLIPTLYRLTIGGQRQEYAPERVVHFCGFSAESTIYGLSPLETLRRILAEEQASGEYREYFWQNAARQHGIIERPREAPQWGEEARERFANELQALYSGSENSGLTMVLEDGMTWKPIEFTAQESEYLAARKLTREECARAYHIPPPLVGILDHATFSNIKEQHKSLYSDTLGPWLVMAEETVDSQLLPLLDDAEGVYTEFNIAAKLAGDFAEQAQTFSTAVGRPYMTANEARSRLNLPRLEGDADELVTPLNVIVGGQASPRDSAPDNLGAAGKSIEPALLLKAAGAGEIDSALPRVRQRHIDKWREVLVKHFGRQRAAVLQRLIDNGDLAALWQPERWNRELGDDLYRMSVATATVWGEYVAGQLGSEFSLDPLLNWLQDNSRIAAEEINASTRAQLEAAALNPELADAVQKVFEIAEGSRASMLAESRVTTTSNYGAESAARQSGIKTKTWVVNSSNPRSAHLAMAGETAPIGTRFSNGMLCPGDPAGGADNNSNCQCSLTFGR